MKAIRTMSMKTMCTAVWLLLIAAAGFALGNHSLAAETYPTRPLHIVVPFSPGGFIDFTTRLIAGPLTDAFGQQVVVDNRAGAGGIVGTEYAARATGSGGYVLVIGSVGTHAVNQSLYAKLSYNVLRDFKPVARITQAPSILAVNPSLPVHSVKDLIELARSKPGKINFASAGAGTSTHLAAALFEYLAKVKLTHVPYKGGGPAVRAVVANEVPVTFATAASLTPQIKSGKLRGIAVTGGKRIPALPDLPTIAETGVKGYEMTNWLGMFAPADTPDDVVEKLSSEVVRIVQMPKIEKGFEARGAESSPLGAKEFKAFVKSEIEKWATVVKESGMTAK